MTCLGLYPGCDNEPGDPCATCELVEHDERHPRRDVDGCPTCKMLSVRLSDKALPTKRRSSAPPKPGSNSWERGIATDHRGVPYLDGNGSMIGVKQFAQNRSRYEEQIRRNRAGAA